MFKKMIHLSTLALILSSSACAAVTVSPSEVGPPAEEKLLPPLDDRVARVLRHREIFHTPDNHPLYRATCQIRTKDEKYSGSGVFIEQDMVLTVAHLARHCEGGFVCLEPGDQQIKVIDVWLPAGAPLYPFTRSEDIAILKLEECVEQVTPLDMLFEFPSLPTCKRYESVLLSGCSLGYKKQSQPGTFFYYGVLKTEPFSIKLWSPKGTVWYGDSGGPVVIKRGNSYLIVGVISGFDALDNYVVDVSVTSTQYYQDEVEEYLNNN
tara:strand:- start:414 stop:1208 length:795 start_codon:yes stop_codon:yes gene_type:complete